MTTLLRSFTRRHWPQAGALLLTALLGGSGPAQAQTTAYCATGLGGSCGANDITGVGLSGTTLNATGLTCAATGGQSYASYPATGTTTGAISGGVPYTLSVTLTGSSIVSVWVDYNHNFVYEASEWTQVATASPTGTPASVTLLVPTTAVQGTTGMRVRSRGTGSPNGATNACTSFFSGETKDFTLTVGAPAACPSVSGLATSGITATGASVAFTPASAATTYTVTVTPAGGTATTQTVTASPIVLTGLTASTSYTVSIVGNCGAGQTSAANTITFATGCASAPYATVNNTTPYTQDFEATWLSQCGTREAPDANWRGLPLTGNTAWRRDDDGTSAAWSSTLGTFAPAGSPLGTGTSLHAARFHSYDASSGTRGTLDLAVNMAGTVGTPTLEFDYINTSGADSLKVFVSTNGGTTFSAALLGLNTAAAWTHQTVNLPATGVTATTVIRLRGRGDFGGSDIGLDNVRVSYVACAAVTNLVASGITATGAVLNFSPPTGPTTYTVTVTPAGGTATTVSPAPSAAPITLTGLISNTVYTVSIVSNCSGSTTSTATATTFTTSCAAAPYVLINNTTPYTQDFEAAWTSQCGTNNIPAVNWRSTPLTGNNAWRRNDDGVSAAWTSPTLGIYAPVGSPLGTGTSLYSARFHSRNVTGRALGSLDLYANMAGTAGTPVLSFDYINTSGTDSLKVFVSTNGGTTFSAALLGLNTAAAWTRQTINLPTTSLTATTIIRLRAVGDFGTTDIGLDNVNITYQACAAVTAATATGITAATATVSFTPASGPTNYTVTVTPAGGTPTTQTVTTSPIVLTGLTASTSYTVSIVGNCGAGSTSQPTVVTFLTSCVAAPYAPVNNTTPYTQDFEATWLSQCGTREAPDASWRGLPLTGDNAWRRDDDGTSAAWNSTLGAFAPAGSPLGTGTSLHAARFHSYDTANGTRGTLDLSVNMAGTVGTPTLEFDYINTSGADSLKVFVSTNGGTTFSAALLGLNTAAAWTHQTVNLPATGLTATTVIRLRGRGDYGFTDIGVDNVRVSYIACAAVTAAAATGITATGATVGFTPASGSTTYTVTVTPAGGTATTQTITASPIALTGLTPSTSYTVSIVGNCGAGSTSQPTVVTFSTACVTPLYAALPVTESFENTWLSRCGTQDVPTANWRNTPVTGDNSWRREDDGPSGAWASPTNWAYTPTSSQGTHSARFHSGEAANGLVGTLDLFVNLSAAGAKRLSFDYINTSGTDSLTVQLSTDGGLSFSRLAGYNLSGTAAAGFATQVLPISSTSATAVLRFRGRADYGVTDIGLDNIVLESATGCLTPANLMATTTTTTAALSWLAGGTGTYTVVYGPTGFSPATGGTTVSGLTAPPLNITGLVPGTTYQFYVTQNCSGTTNSGTAGPSSFTTQITNDDPCGATTLPVTNTCTPLATTTVGATTTASTVYGTGGQGVGCGSNTAPRDVWFAFTTAATGPTSTAVRITVTGGAASAVRGYSGTACAGPLTYLSCSGTATNTAAPVLDLTALAPSTTYYVRVSEYSTFGSTLGNFTICATPVPNCPTPTGLAVGTLTNTTAVLTWSTPVVAGNTYTVIYGPAGFNPATSGTTLTPITAQTVTLTGLTASTSYGFYVRQVCGGFNGNSTLSAVFSFTTPLTAPANDEPCGAVALGTTAVTGSNVGATTSVQNGINTPACSPAALPKDVWFSFTATATTRALNVTGTVAGMVRVFSTPDCAAGPFNQVFCQAATGSNLSVGSVTVTGLTVGTVYYVAVSGYGSSDATGSFTILSLPTATRAQADTDALLVYPNPSNTGQLTLRLKGLSTAGQATLFNALGQVVAAKTLSGTTEQTLSTRGLATGLYTLRVTVAGQVLTRKVVLE